MLPSEYTPTGNEEGKFSPADMLFKYLAYLPLFIISLAGSVALGIAYLRYSTPVFESSVQMLVLSGERNPVYGGEGDIVERALYGPREINMNNEITKLRNVNVVTRAVKKHNFNIQYFIEGNIKTRNISGKIPYFLQPVTIMDSSRLYRVKFTNINQAGYTIIWDEKKHTNHRWQDEFNLEGGIFKLQPGGLPDKVSPSNAIFIASWGNPQARAVEILRQMQITSNANTTILSFNLRNDNVDLGKQILNALVHEYIQYSVETKNTASTLTVEFIKDRLDSLSGELRQIEQGLQDYRDANEVLSLDLQTSLYADRFTEAQDGITALDWELEVLNYFEKYARSDRPRTDLAPSAMGLTDDVIPTLTTRYNELRLQRERDARQMAPNSFPLQQLDKQLEDVQKTLFERIDLFHKCIF